MLLRLIEKDKRGAFMRGKIWSEQETYIAFLLYCQIPFGQIDKRNPKIIELANLLDRTPSSVGMKLCNFAANDPLIQARGVKGLQNCSIKDKQVFEAFKSDWDKNLEIAQAYLQDLEAGHITYQPIEEPQFVIGEYPSIHERYATVKARASQGFFRNAVLASYKNTCCVTGLSIKETLIASHIKPWSESADSEKADPTNGLCLNSFHDRLFDSGLMTVTPDLIIHYSPKIREFDVTETEKDWLAKFNNQRIHVPDKFGPGKEFLEYHNDIIFKR